MDSPVDRGGLPHRIVGYTATMPAVPNTYSWRLLRAGGLRLDGGSMFGVVPKAIWSRLVMPDAHNRIPLQTNCLLLRQTGCPPQSPSAGPILIETGFGTKWSDKERGFYDLERRDIVDALREVDIAPEQIAHVIVTHLHFDHAAGLTRLQKQSEKMLAVPTFVNADVIVQRREWEDALTNKSTMNRTYLPDHLDPVADRVRLVDGEAEVLPGIHVWPMPGHTWGQQAVRFRDEHGVVVFAGDVLPTVNHVGLPFSLAYDMEPYTSMLSKRHLYKQAIANDWRLALDHEPGEPAVFRVRSDRDKPDKFTLEPA
jgi:glyoxylase-like metal-dependent hydrolase (beta-lactamase superfamily II)